MFSRHRTFKKIKNFLWVPGFIMSVATQASCSFFFFAHSFTHSFTAVDLQIDGNQQTRVPTFIWIISKHSVSETYLLRHLLGRWILPCGRADLHSQIPGIFAALLFLDSPWFQSYLVNNYCILQLTLEQCRCSGHWPIPAPTHSWKIHI